VRSGHIVQQTRWREGVLGRSWAVDSCGTALGGTLDAGEVPGPAHFEVEAEGKNTGADRPDQPGPEVGHAHHTAWAGLAHSGLDRLVQVHEHQQDRRVQRQGQTRLARRQDGTGTAD